MSSAGSAAVSLGEWDLLTMIKSDASLTSWRTGTIPEVPKAALLERTVRRLAALSIEAQRGNSAGEQPSLAFLAAWGLLVYLLKDDSATPQIASDGEGGVEINWLVDGDWMRVHIDSAASVELESGWSNGGDELDVEFDAWHPDAVSLSLAQAFLEKISQNVRFRVT